jgi:hypothetical protein
LGIRKKHDHNDLLAVAEMETGKYISSSLSSASIALTVGTFSAWYSLYDKGNITAVGTYAVLLVDLKQKKEQTLWPQSASKLYRPSYRRLSAKLLPIFADRGCRVVSMTDPSGSILNFLDRSHYFFFQVVPQLHS